MPRSESLCHIIPSVSSEESRAQSSQIRPCLVPRLVTSETWLAGDFVWSSWWSRPVVDLNISEQFEFGPVAGNEHKYTDSKLYMLTLCIEPPSL